MRFPRNYAFLAILAVTLTLAFAADRGFGRQASKSSTLSAKAPAVKSTSGRVARGRYLVEGPAFCMECHSEVNWKDPGVPALPGKLGAGAKSPNEAVPFVYCPNITPDRETGIGSWTDAEIGRAIREGVSRDGRRLFPMMPYMLFRVISDEDLASIIAYLRSIPPVHNVVPKTQLPEPVKASLPPPMPITGPVPPPDFSNPVKRGEYLTHIGNCTGCHTPRDPQRRPLPGMDFAGGLILTGPWGRVAGANITPDASGISYYNEALFLQAMRTGRVRTRKLNVIMPWGHFRHMTDADLKAIYAYLRTIEPVVHRVDNTEPPTDCKRCGVKHGYGDRN